jgi:hypothetical protein
VSDAADFLAELADDKHRRRVDIQLLLRQDLAVELERLDREVNDELHWVASGAIGDPAELDDRKQAMWDKAKRIEALTVEAEGSWRTFTFRSIGKRAWYDLVRDHPPTQAQLKANPQADVNRDTFEPAAMAASCESPTVTLEQAEQFRELLGTSQWDMLVAALFDANVGGLGLPKALAAGLILRQSDAFDRQPTTTGSPAASSSAGSKPKANRTSSTRT